VPRRADERREALEVHGRRRLSGRLGGLGLRGGVDRYLHALDAARVAQSPAHEAVDTVLFLWSPAHPCQRFLVTFW
jgi:hypothetical protein